jgi:hypothetical protein
MSEQFVFRCPRSEMNVQIWLAKDASTNQTDASTNQTNAFESLTCPACSRLHFINKATGKLLGHKEK